jgi:uncharacterized protein (DUF305 family)
MPTVPKYDGPKIDSAPIPGVRVSSTATEETFGGGAAKAAIGAAASQIGSTTAKLLEHENKLNQRMATVNAMNEDKAEILKSHYDTTIKDVEITDSLGNKSMVKTPSGIMLRQGKDASLDGGVSRLSIQASDAVVARRLARLSPDEQQVYISAMGTWVPTINDRAATYETQQMKTSTEADMNSTLENTASDPVVPFDQKIKDIRSQAKLFSQKLGLPDSEYQNKVKDATYKAAKAELATMLNAGTGTTKDAEDLIKKAQDAGVDSIQIKDLKGDIEESKIKSTLRRNQAQTDTINESLQKGLQKDWFGMGQALEKLPPTGDAKIDEQINIINNDRKKLGGVVDSDKGTLNSLNMMMVNPSIPDRQKATEIYKATAEGKLSRSDWKNVTNLYSMSPEEKKATQVGINGIDDWVKNNAEDNPNAKFDMTNEFLSEMQKKKPEETANDVLNNVIYNFATRNIPSLANKKKEDMPNSIAQMNGGNGMFYQKLGAQPSAKKPDVMLVGKPSAFKEGDTREKDGKTYQRQKDGSWIPVK